jgi:hypothetical protein
MMSGKISIYFVLLFSKFSFDKTRVHIPRPEDLNGIFFEAFGSKESEKVFQIQRLVRELLEGGREFLSTKFY